MDYMKELNAFRNWQLLNPISTGEVALWHTLMSLNNMTGWKEWFVVPNSTVQLLTGMSKQGVDNARNKLIQRRLIEYQKGGKNEAGRYKMLPVSKLVNFQTQKLDQLVDQFVDDQLTSSLTSSGTDACPLIDIDNIKTINTTSATTDARASESEECEPFYKAYERVNQRMLTPYQAEQISKYIDEEGFDERVVVHAIERAGLKSSDVPLILKILNDYAAAGAKTLERAIAFDNEYENRRRLKQNAKPRASPASDEYDYNALSL